MTKLAKYLKLSNTTRKGFAQKVGTTPNNLGLLADGKSTPTLKLAYKIERATGGLVTLYDWLTLAEIEAIKDQVPEPIKSKHQLE